MAEQEGFLGRWSRRKAEARREGEGTAPEAAEIEGGIAGAGAAPAEDARDIPPDEETEKRWVAELEKVDIEKLTYKDDFSVFMKSWVPQALRQKALRKLWTTDPALTLNDGLDDWCGDYTDAATVVPGFKSSWLPGKGYSWLDEIVGEDEESAGADTADRPESAAAAKREEAADLERAETAEPESDENTSRAASDHDVAAEPSEAERTS